MLPLEHCDGGVLRSSHASHHPGASASCSGTHQRPQMRRRQLEGDSRATVTAWERHTERQADLNMPMRVTIYSINSFNQLTHTLKVISLH